MPAFVILLTGCLPLCVAAQSNVALGKNGLASSEQRNLSHIKFAWRAFDGDTQARSEWQSQEGSGFPAWLEVDLKGSHTLTGFNLYNRLNKQADYAYPVVDFDVQYWDGEQWVDVLNERDHLHSGVVEMTFAPLRVGNRIRYTALRALGGASRTNVNEMEYIGTPDPLQPVQELPAAGSLELQDLAPVISLQFNAAVTLADATRVGLRNLTGGTPVAGVTVAVDGDTLLLSAPALHPGTSYGVFVREGAVASAANPADTNGTYTWNFSTDTAAPARLALTQEIAATADDIVLTYDRELQLLGTAGIEVMDLGSGQLVAPLAVSVSGSGLHIGHPGLSAGNAYRVTIPAGIVSGASYGTGANAPETFVAYAGKYTLMSTGWDSGTAEGWTVGQWANNWDNQHKIRAMELTFYDYQNGYAGPSYDYTCLHWGTNNGFHDGAYLYEIDYVASPAVELEAGMDYTFDAKFVLEGAGFDVSLNTQPDRSGMTAIHQYLKPPKTAQWWQASGNPFTFTATESGSFHVVLTSLYAPWVADNYLDDVQLIKRVPPALAVAGISEGASFLENDTITISGEAWGISSQLKEIRIYDGASHLATLAGPVFSFNWSSHLPGVRTVRVVAEDTKGVQTERACTITITFNDGTLDTYVDYSIAGGTITSLISDPNSYVIRTNNLGESVLRTKSPHWLATPQLFLKGGAHYKVLIETRLARKNRNSNPLKSVYCAIDAAARNMRGEESSADGFYTFPWWSGTEADVPWDLLTFPVIPPADGPYHVNFWLNPISGTIDWDTRRVRVIGDINSAPAAALAESLIGLRTLAGVDIRLLGDYSDPDGSIARVEYFVDGNLLGESTSAPDFDLTWQDVPAGNYSLVARAYDNNGGYADSAPAAIGVEPNHFSLSTAIGGADVDEAVYQAAYQSDGTLVLAGVLDPAVLASVFPSVVPVYLNGAVIGDRGLVARLSTDGTSLLSLTVVGESAYDLALDAADNLYVALGIDGMVKLDPSATSVLLSAGSAPKYAQRIDASADGTCAVLVTTQANPNSKQKGSVEVPLYDAAGAPLGIIGGSGQWTTDLCVDQLRQQVVMVGFKNISTDGNPVDIPIFTIRDYQNNIRVRGYDWVGNPGIDDGTPAWDVAWERYLNRVTNNMADTRGARCNIGPGGRLYMAFAYDGGNTPLRYSPLDLDTPAGGIIGGSDPNHSNASTGTVPKVFVGEYDPVTGELLMGQYLLARLSSGGDNTIRIEEGDLAIDTLGRIHVVGSAAANIAHTHDLIPGSYNGGFYHYVYSPDMTVREWWVRYTTSGTAYGVAVAPDGTVAVAGAYTNGSDTSAAFEVNPWQSPTGVGNQDAFLVTGDTARYYTYRGAIDHPRLFFGPEDIPELRGRLDREPYASMFAKLLLSAGREDWGQAPSDPADPYDVSLNAQILAFLYVLTGDEAHALACRDKVDWIINTQTTMPWADPGLKGLNSYWLATRVACAFDWCATSAAWDDGFDYMVSTALRDIGRMIVESGGTEQNTASGSNWQGSRGAAGALALLATDNTYDPALLDSAWNRVTNYVTAAYGGSPDSRGYTSEGQGYFAFPVGNYVGPMGIAMARHDPARDLRGYASFRWAFYTPYASSLTAVNALGFGGIHPDWSNDNPGIAGEGVYGLAFHYAPASLLRNIRYAYDLLMGGFNPNGPEWDEARGGTLWSFLYYRDDLVGFDPMLNYDWLAGSDDSAHLGVFTFRDSYIDSQDLLAQFMARLASSGGNNGPDGLGIRILGGNTAWVVGGGRNTPANFRQQATVYPQNPNDPGVTINTNQNLGTLAGTPLLKPFGDGHAIARMTINNVGAANHKRWFVADYENPAADAVYLVADTSDGRYWQLPTYFNNTVSITGPNTFTISAPSGETLAGTILHPVGANLTLTTGVAARGSHYGLLNGGDTTAEVPATNPQVVENKYIVAHNAAGGDFLAVLTVQRAGTGHPAPARASGTAGDATVTVGDRTYALQADTVLYGIGGGAPAPYTAPDAVITFIEGDHGTITAGDPVQSVPFGGAAVEPMVIADSGWQFAGWDKAFDAVVRSMDVLALYNALADAFTAWINGYPAVPPDQRAKTHNWDRDQYDNFLEYAFFMDPGVPDSGGPLVHLDGANLQVVFDTSRMRQNLVYGVEVSHDLSAWETIAEARYGAGFAPSLTAEWLPAVTTDGDSVTITDSFAPGPTGGSSRFIRVYVTE